VNKTKTETGEVSITFELSAEAAASTAVVCGDFNGWSLTASPMRRREDGSFVATLVLPLGRYEFRYCVDGDRWFNDWHADDYVRNDLGSDNSVVIA